VLEVMDENNKGLGSAVFEESRKMFESHLERQLSNTKLPGAGTEPPALDELPGFQKRGHAYSLLDQQAAQREAFQKSLMPSLLAIDNLLDKIYTLNDNAILSITPNVQKITRDATRVMILCIVVAMSIASYACYKLARSIVIPSNH